MVPGATLTQTYPSARTSYSYMYMCSCMPWQSLSGWRSLNHDDACCITCMMMMACRHALELMITLKRLPRPRRPGCTAALPLSGGGLGRLNVDLAAAVHMAAGDRGAAPACIFKL